MDETANQEDIYKRIEAAVLSLNALLKEAEDAGLPLGVAFPLRPDQSRVFVWDGVERVI